MEERKVIEGTATTTIDVAGWVFAQITGKVEITTVRGNMTTRHRLDPMGRFMLPGDNQIQVNAHFNEPWKIVLYKTVPVINQTELSCVMTADGDYVFSGDEDVTYIGQNIDPATVDISGLRIDVDSVARLYNRTIIEKTPESAARYLKMKEAFIKFSRTGA